MISVFRTFQLNICFMLDIDFNINIRFVASSLLFNHSHKLSFFFTYIDQKLRICQLFNVFCFQLLFREKEQIELLKTAQMRKCVVFIGAFFDTFVIFFQKFESDKILILFVALQKAFKIFLRVVIFNFHTI